MMKDAPTVKCVIWDLDDTLWDGVLIENDRVRLRQDAVKAIEVLDQRGILHSIASRNDHDLAMAKIEEFGLADYFLYPQINWGPKSDSVARIADLINIGVDTLAFVDDQPFERDEVLYRLPAVLSVDAADVEGLPSMPRMQPKFLTDDARNRRMMYQSDIRRTEVEQSFAGSQEDFLSTLGMVFTIAPATGDDLCRAEELTVRTNQLNTTGYTYSFEELDRFRTSDRHRLLIASLEDRYGAYGKIGLVLLQCDDSAWTIKLLLMSCRVASRGVGTVLINHIRERARSEGVRLLAELIPNDRNRMMLVAYRFARFEEIGVEKGVTIFEGDLTDIPPRPGYIDVRMGDW